MLDRRGGRILPNVNRWRNQINRNFISEKELPLVTSKFPMAGVDATLIEMKGFKNPSQWNANRLNIHCRTVGENPKKDSLQSAFIPQPRTGSNSRRFR